MAESFLQATISIRGVVRGPDGDVLVLRRTSDDGWELPGGRIHRAESVTGCLRREIREETDLTVSIDGPVHAVTWQNEAGDDRFAVYYACRTSGSDVSISHEHTDAAWLDATAARERLSEPQATATRRTVGDSPGDV